MKLSELPAGCACCGKALVAKGCNPMVYRVDIAPHVINPRAINQVAGLALAWGRPDEVGFKLAEVLAPDGYDGLVTDPVLARTLWLCADCHNGASVGHVCLPLGVTEGK